MLFNELLFIAHSITLSIFALIALRLGKEALVAYISVTCILANLFVIKQTSLCGLTATCADAFTIGAVLGLNLLQEYYGRAIGKKAIWISFVLLVLYAIASQLHLWYIPAMCDSVHGAFISILSSMPRIVIASFTVYLIVQHIDSWLYALLKNRWADNYLVLRNCITISLCQLLDTVLFSFFGLYGIVEHIGDIILVSYSIKLMAMVLAIPFVALSRRVKPS